jgi:putative addiction module killer protein
MKYEIYKASEFDKWFADQAIKTKLIIKARLERLSQEGHWGFINKFDGLVELKWTSGLRVYTAVVGNVTVIILLGGNKNGQSKDIKKAKNILASYFDKI